MRIFFGKKEKALLKTLEIFVDTVYETVAEYDKQIKELKNYNIEEAKNRGEKVINLESKADEYKIQFEMQLQKSFFIPSLRADLFRLAERIDEIADTTEDATKEMLQRERLFGIFNSALKIESSLKGILKDFSLFSSSVREMVDIFREGIHKLDSNIEEAREKFSNVEEKEHEVRNLSDKIVKSIFLYEDTLDVITLYQIKEVTQLTAKIARDTEDAADIATIIAFMYH